MLVHSCDHVLHSGPVARDMVDYARAAGHIGPPFAQIIVLKTLGLVRIVLEGSDIDGTYVADMERNKRHPEVRMVTAPEPKTVLEPLCRALDIVAADEDVLQLI